MSHRRTARIAPLAIAPMLPAMLPLALALALVLVLVLAGCAAQDPSTRQRPVQPALALDIALDAGKTSERCVSLVAGQQVSWRFTASAPVDFNVHTHRGRAAVTPVERLRATDSAGSHPIDQPGDYCLAWANRGAIPAFVRGEWSSSTR